MSVVVPLYLFNGVVHPVSGPDRPRLSALYYDAATDTFLAKQTRDFDSGWRWFYSDISAYVCIYNRKLDPRACAMITRQELMENRVDAEFTLQCAQARCLVEHAYYTARNAVLDFIQAEAKKARKDIYGETAPVRARR